MQVDLFNAAYDGSLRVVDDAMEMWKDVDLARRKGRLKTVGIARRTTRKNSDFNWFQVTSTTPSSQIPSFKHCGYEVYLEYMHRCLQLQELLSIILKHEGR